MDDKPAVILSGRSYPLFRRGDFQTTPWCVRVQSKGVRRAISTGTPDLRQAKQRAEIIVAAALAGDWSAFESFRQPRQPHKPNASVGQLLQASLKLTTASAAHYRASLIHILETTGHTPPGDQPSDILTAPLARAYQAKMQGMKQASPDTPTERNATANSHLKNARCLFSRKALALYERHGLSLPDLSGFLSVPLLIVEQSRYSDHPIPDATLHEINTALPSLPAPVRKAHAAIRLQGTPPGEIRRPASTAHARFLKRWNLTPSDLWHHAAACMLRRTGSLEVAAAWASMSITSAKWHLGAMVKEIEPLKMEETYLGL